MDLTEAAIITLDRVAARIGVERTCNAFPELVSALQEKALLSAPAAYQGSRIGFTAEIGAQS